MRRASVVTNRAPTSVTLTVPPSARDEREYRSGSNDVSSQDGTEVASTVLGGNQNSGWESAADFKDTVLYLAQQQSIHHKEIMETLKQVAAGLALSRETRAATPRQANSRQQVEEEEQVFVSSHEHQLQRVLDYGRAIDDPSSIKDASKWMHEASGTVGGYTATQESWFNNVSGIEVELHAAKARILQLESVNRLLQQQLEQKEASIKRLTQSNIASLTQRIGGNVSSFSPSTAVRVNSPATPARHAVDLVPYINTPRSMESSPALRLMLQKHQESCAASAKKL